ncbi:hypothetical protein K493DRAFT_316533 [Basidiobolus meristosporus CBS 931.73]|uniref:Cyclin N-terminal domain-containing protein n=1 Tax=Basidiobolus meristosporus CBS 931.73 TaxID=1314790 RepID=A0A1Y1Y3C8_9FUNG|nr:hypothetical protein K493DRAFT_316533 [Basidiobolus meristosporus CBS 931.73]|eukprot:ORX92532.1 hypothetical protein K493DRAFT_316533 [Basidiobolus meristosporus CBS 931.73]
MSLSQLYLVQSLFQPSRPVDQIPTQHPWSLHSSSYPPSTQHNISHDFSCIPKTLIPDNNVYLGDVAANVIYFVWYTNPNPFSLPAYHTFRMFCIHVLNHIRMSPATVILALKYVQKLRKMNRSMRGELGSEYRIFIVSMMLAAKFLEDITYTSQSWSTITGMPTREIAVMEREFLAGLKYELHISNSAFLHWFQTVQMYCINQQQWLRRSFLAQKSSSDSLLLTQPYQPYERHPVNHVYLPQDYLSPPLSNTSSFIGIPSMVDDTSTPSWF